VIVAGCTLPDAGSTKVEIAVVGAGAVGVAIASRLAAGFGRIALIEAGGPKFEFGKQVEFFRAAEISDRRHPPTELNRRRMLGGTTSVWGGRCIPLDREDFLPDEGRCGWPLTFDEVAAHIPAALEFLRAGRAEFSSALALPGLPLSPESVDGDLRVDQVERFSEPTNVWKKWGAAFSRSSQVTVIHGAACANIITSAEGARVLGLELRTVLNRSHKILAPSVVLACGGLETPRLLLASRDRKSCGLGNDHDLVGRFYMTHFCGDVGRLRFAHPEIARKFDYGLTPDGVYARRLILLSPAARRREGIPNIVFRPTIPPIADAAHGDPVLSAMFVAKGLITPEYARRLLSQAPEGLSRSSIWRDHGANIAFGIPNLCGFGVDWLKRRILATRKLPSVFLYRTDATYPLEFNAEQLPNPQSRVQLGAATDPFGVPRLIVQWGPHESEAASICRGYRVLAAAVSKIGLGEIALDPDLPNIMRSNLMPSVGHHIGTARIGQDARSGVVGPDCEVWGTRGLFVAGPAIFPSSGFANPTLTAVALAFRLAEHLKRLYGGSRPGPAAGRL
jgi:choline dehydrogenase-like flavoprotein